MVVIYLWKYNFTEAHYSIFTSRGSLKESPEAFAAPVRTPMLILNNNSDFNTFKLIIDLLCGP